MQDKPKGLTSWQRSQKRVDAGLPRFTEREKASRKARDARRAEERIAVNLQFVTELKLARGCADCGYNDHPAALDFDHLPGTEKRRDMSRMLTVCRSTLLAEIAKCEVVCANCHRIRTWKRKQNDPEMPADASSGRSA